MLEKMSGFVTHNKRTQESVSNHKEAVFEYVQQK